VDKVNRTSLLPSQATEFLADKNINFYLTNVNMSDLNLGMNNKLEITNYIANFLRRNLNNKRSKQQFNYVSKIIKMFSEISIFKNFKYPVTINPVFNNTTCVYDFIHPGLKRLALCQYLKKESIKVLYCTHYDYTPLYLKNKKAISFQEVLKLYGNPDIDIFIHPLNKIDGNWQDNQTVVQVNFMSKYYHDIPLWEDWITNILSKLKIYSQNMDLQLLSNYQTVKKSKANVKLDLTQPKISSELEVALFLHILAGKTKIENFFVANESLYKDEILKIPTSEMVFPKYLKNTFYPIQNVTNIFPTQDV